MGNRCFMVRRPIMDPNRRPLTWVDGAPFGNGRLPCFYSPALYLLMVAATTPPLVGAPRQDSPEPASNTPPGDPAAGGDPGGKLPPITSLPPPRTYRTGLYAVLAVLAIVAVVLGALAADGYFSPKTGVKGGSQTILNGATQTLGPGRRNASVTPFTVPSNALGAWVNGTSEVPNCDYDPDCGFAAILTPSNWTDYLAGEPLNVIWCGTWGGSECVPLAAIEIASGDLAEYAGLTLDLCLWSNATAASQQFSAQAEMTWVYTD